MKTFLAVVIIILLNTFVDVSILQMIGLALVFIFCFSCELFESNRTIKEKDYYTIKAEYYETLTIKVINETADSERAVG